MSYERPNLTPAERALDRSRSDSYYLLKATLITIQRPGMNLEDVDHAIENLNRAQESLETYAREIQAYEGSTELPAG